VERTHGHCKPDAVQRGLVGTILNRFEQKGLKLVGLKMRHFPDEVIQQHYSVHADKPFYGALVGFMTSGPVVAIALEGKDAINCVRGLMGKTNSAEAAPGTIRGDLGLSFSNNLVHGSDGPESAETELALFFAEEGDLIDWTPDLTAWVYSAEELS